MKQLVSVAFIILTSLYTDAKAQTSQSLKQENVALRQQVQKLKDDTLFLKIQIRQIKALDSYSQFEIKPIANTIDTKILSCKGDRNNQIVTIEFIVSHKLLNQNLCIANDQSNIKAFDALGNELPAKAVEIGSASTMDVFGGGKCNKIPTDVPVKGFVTFKNVLPGTDILKFVTVAFKFRNFDSDDEYVYGTLEVRNIKVKW
jgi:hypothetical protein